MGQTLTWERTEDNGSVGVTVNNTGGPETGATVVARFRDPDSADLWLDLNDNAWKTNATVTTLDLALAEVDAVDAPGRYEANLDFGATTGFPAASHRVEAIYVVTTPTGFPVDTDVVELVQAYLDVATQAQILSDATPFQGADVAAILTDTADIQPKIGAPVADVSADIAAVKADTAATLVDTSDMQPKLGTPAVDVSADIAAVKVDTTATLLDTAAIEPLVTANLDATISSRSDFDEAANPVEILDAGGAAGTSAAELVADVNTNLTGSQGAGQWDGTDSDWTVAERENIRDALGVSGTKTAATGGQVQDILTDTAAIQPTVATNLDVTVSSRATQVSVDAIAQAIVSNSLAAIVGSTSAEVRTGATQANGFYDDAQLIVVNTAGTAVRRVTGYLNANGAFTVDPVLPFTPSISDPVIVLNRLASSAIDVAALVDAVWDEDVVAAHGAADSAGLLLRVLGAVISARANNATLGSLLGVADTAGTDLPEQVNTELETNQGHGAGAWTTGSVITSQAVRDAMKLSPTGGAPAAGSVDEHLDGINTDTATIEPLVSTNLDATVSSRESEASASTRATTNQTEHDATQVDIAALNDLSIVDVQTALTNQGYTVARAANLDNLDAAISSLNDLSIVDVQAALTAQGYTPARAVLIDNLDATISSVATAIGALNDLSQADVQAAMTAQGYTSARSILLDNLDATISSIPASVDVVLTATHGAGSWTSASASADWTVAEREQFRDALGIAGVKTAAVAGQLQALKAQADKIDDAATTVPASAATGSLLDRLANKDAGKNYNPALHSLQAIRDREG